MGLTPATFARRWSAAATSVPDRPFLIFEASDGTTTEFTYARADRLISEVASGLRQRGVGSGSMVHLVHTNSVGFVATWLACSRIGAAIVPSDPRASSHELTEHVSRTRPIVGICSPDRATEYRNSVARSGVRVEVVEVDTDDVELSSLRGPLASTEPHDDVRPDTRLAVMFTSGTTSAPKGVELTQHNYAFTGDVMAAVSGLTRYDRQLVVLPMFHANAQFYSVAAAISAGASVALMHTFSASQFVEQARRHDATHASLFAAPIRMILARTPAGTKPLSLRHAWFAQNLSAAHFAAISHLLGCRPRQLYGMTETGPAVLVNPPVGSRETSIGLPALGCSVRVVDHDQRPVRAGEVGSIQVGGTPGATIFRSYLDDPATTSAAYVEQQDDGFVWFDTGDRAIVDDDGFHYFDGRNSDVLKVGGENVSIVEVEHALGEHPGVADVAVVGIADDMYDEVPIAYVVIDDDHLSVVNAESTLAEWSEQHLAPSKRPRQFRLVDELPRTSVGKVRKFLLLSDDAAVT